MLRSRMLRKLACPRCEVEEIRSWTGYLVRRHRIACQVHRAAAR